MSNELRKQYLDILGLDDTSNMSFADLEARVFMSATEKAIAAGAITTTPQPEQRKIFVADAFPTAFPDHSLFYKTTATPGEYDLYYGVNGAWTRIKLTGTTAPSVDYSAPPSFSGSNPVEWGRLSGIHWAEYKADSDAAATWRGRPMDIIPGYVGRDQWQSINTYSGWAIEQYVGPQGSTAVLMPEVKQFNLFVPFVPEVYYTDYPAAFATLRAGGFDAEWYKFGAWLTKYQFPARIHIIIAWEWNGNWFPFNGSHLIPADWIACFRRIVEQIRLGYQETAPPVGISKKVLTFGTCNSTGSSPGIPSGYTSFDYFPGKQWCDSWGLNVYDIWEPVYNEAGWDQKKFYQFNAIQAHADFAAAQGVEFGIPEWGIWNIDIQEGAQDPRAGGNDNPFFIQKMFEWFNQNNVAWETYFEHPQTPYHWISTARVQHNPLSGAKYKELLPPPGTANTGGGTPATIDEKQDTLENALLLPQSHDFEDGTKFGWLPYDTGTHGLVNTTEQAQGGTKSLKFVSATGALVTGTTTRYIKIDTPGTLNIGSRFYLTGGSRSGQIAVIHYDEGGNYLRNGTGYNIPSTAPGSWATANLAASIPADCKYVRVQMQFYGFAVDEAAYLDTVTFSMT